MAAFTYSFKARITERDFGRMSYAVVDLPAKVCKDLPLSDYPRLRVRGAINDVAHKGALQPKGDKKWCLMLSKRVMKSCGVAIGDRVSVGFEIDDQDAVDVPVELAEAIAQDDMAARIWGELTPGKQRGFSYMVDSAKRTETRERRAKEVLEMLYELDC